MQFRTEIITHIDDFFIKDWEELWKKSENANIYNSYEWFLTCLQTYAVKEYEIYACYKNDQLVALLPLQPYKCFGIKVFGTFCKEQLVDTAFLMEKYEKVTFKHLFEAILEKQRNIYFQKFDNKAIAILHELFPQFFISLMSVNPTIDLEGYPSTSISQSTISKIKKIVKKNAEQLQFAVYSENLQEHLETMFKLQESSSKKARSMDIFANEKTKEYYRNLTKNCHKFVRIHILSFDKLPIAYEYGFLCGKNYSGEQVSYHNDYKKLSPGKIIVYKLIEQLQKEKIKTADQGGGINSYKLSFTQDYRLLYNIYYSPNICIMFWWRSINKVRRIKQVLFPKKNTRDHEFLFKTI
ncbi:MAG TPA: GNAT family N-acetyltransferase [Candidatus Saccharimonadales bacterium]|nr:GNAT family N-acetyltransferase [Candidatus Saccharimonadales bacterium]